MTIDTITIDGEYSTAEIKTQNVDDTCIEQVRELVDHEAFQQPIKVMPDAHAGAGAVIGFTMPLGYHICPNTVGVDIGCFAGETKIQLLDGENYRIDELANRHRPFCVYSCTKDGKVNIGQATARKTRSDAKLVEVQLDNGEEIRCTPDHKYMMRDGSYTAAQNLSEGDSLMPLYTGEADNGYRLVFHNQQGHVAERSVREHWLVARSDVMDIPKDIDDPVLHHKNFDKKDNRPKNLEFMTESEHSEYHRSISERNEHWQSEEFEEKRIQALKERDPTDREIEAAVENITSYMEQNREEWLEKISDNGERGAKYLEEFNTSQRTCEFCGKTLENPATEYWHQVKEHPEETEYDLSPNAESAIENHEVTDVSEAGVKEDVYCLNVPKYHNFALSAGVFVHNCGMTALNLGYSEKLDELLTENPHIVDESIRDIIPLGRSTHDDLDGGGGYDIATDFPWNRVEAKIKELNSGLKAYDVADYRADPLMHVETYVETLCEKVGYDRERMEASVGSLGGGNHFIEISQSEQTHDFWVVVHSGSRGIGLAIAEYWQERAHELQDDRASEVRGRLKFLPDYSYRFDLDDVTDPELLAWVRGDMGKDWKHVEAIRDHLDGEAIGELVDELNDVASYVHEHGDGNDLDYLTDQFCGGYLKDMAFAQTYAEVSRDWMAHAVADVLGASVEESIVSTHNYVDFEDLVIRKGATRVHDGERAIIPFNMRDGAVIVRGKGNELWHRSAPHGAGRRGSRRWAKREFDVEEYASEMEDVYSSSVNAATLDEAPMAYKKTNTILDALQETAAVEEELTPVINIKAEE